MRNSIVKRYLATALMVIMLVSLFPMGAQAAAITGVNVPDLEINANGGTWNRYNNSPNALQGQVNGTTGGTCSSSTQNDASVVLKNTSGTTAELSFSYYAKVTKDSRDDATNYVKMNGNTVVTGKQEKNGSVTIRLQPNASYTIDLRSGKGNDYYALVRLTNITLTPLYTVTWKNGDETLETDQLVTKGTQPDYNGVEPVGPTYQGITLPFIGWSTDPYSETGTAEGSLPPVTADVTYYAIFGSSTTPSTPTPPPTPTPTPTPEPTPTPTPGPTPEPGEIYAIFGEGANQEPARTTYKFVAHGSPYYFNNDRGESTDQQVLKNGDGLYDVGVPMANEGEKFVGWYIGETKVAFGEAMTVEANETVTVEARFARYHIVTFYADEACTTILSARQVVEGEDLAVDGLEAVSTSTTKDFRCWQDVDDASATYAANGTVSGVAADMELKPVFDDGAWMTFNADGGSYVAPRFVPGNQLASGTQLTAPTRAGYSFNGWYDGDTRVSSSSGVTRFPITLPATGMTLTAKWTAQTVSYQVAYWWENPDGNGYSLAEKVGNLEPVVTKQGLAGAQATFDDRDYTSAHFNLNETLTNSAAENKTIAGDGTTVRNVYYDRQTFTLTFGTDKTITARYGEYIGDNFPITNDGARWKPSSNSSTFSEVLVYIDTMPAETVTFTKDTGSGINDTKHIEFYVEALPGETGTTYTYPGQPNGTKYVKYGNTIPAKYNFFTIKEDFIDLTTSGFAKERSDPAFDSEGQANPGSNGTLKLYYTRISYGLEFFPNGGPAVVLQNNPPVMFEMPMAGYEPTNYEIGETTKTVDGKTYIFQGWYDNAVFDGDPYDFEHETMPAKAVTLYAKWEPEWFRIEVDPNGGELSWAEDTNTSTFFWKQIGDTFNTYNDVTRNYVEDASGTYYYHIRPYDADLDEPVAVRATYRGAFYTDKTDAHWAKIAGDYAAGTQGAVAMNPEEYTGTTTYRYEQGAYQLIGWYKIGTDGSHTLCADVEEVTGDVKIQAQWRRVGTYTVAYDLGEHGIAPAPSDTGLYSDQAETVAKTAPAAEEDWVFVGWKYGDEIVYPGDAFKIEAALADADKVVTLTAQYRAADEPGNVPTATITWHANDGTDATVVSGPLEMNEGTDIKTVSRENFALIGWAKTADATEANLFLKFDGNGFKALNGSEWQTTTQVATNNPDDSVNHLYAVWAEITPVTYLIDFNAKMKVATEATVLKPVEKKDNAPANGTFTLDETAEEVTYQLNQATKNGNAATISQFSGVDTAMVYGKPVNKGIDKVGWNKITAVPANSIYFDDEFVNKTLTAGPSENGSGYSPDASTSTVVKYTSDSISFTFYGIRLDAYFKTTATKEGVVVKTGDEKALVNGGPNKTSRTSIIIQHNTDPALMNVPAASVVFDSVGTHTVTLTAGSAGFQFDGVRIYKTMDETNTDVQAAYAAENELNAQFVQVRQMLLSAEDFNVLSDDQTVNGVVFVDNSATGTTEVADYKENGPKNEVYLTAGQGIAFKMTGYEGKKVTIGLSASAGTEASVLINSTTATVVSSDLDMYYPVTPDSEGNVYIKNNSGGLLAVTNVKITDVSPSASMEPVTFSASPKLMRFVRSMEAPAAAEETPVPTETPDPMPEIRDILRQLLSSFVQNLFNSIGRLFGGL